MKRLVDWLFGFQIIRLLTDRAVFCERCGGFVGYVWLGGHQRWVHDDCGLGFHGTATAVGA